MRVRFPNTPLAIVALVGAASIIALVGQHHGLGHRQPVGYAPYPVPVVMTAKANASIADATAPRLAFQASESASSGYATASGPRLMPPPRGGRGPSQLIRTANLRLDVDDVSKALRTATAITDEQLGDVIGLTDESPESADFPHTATMEIRVPQYRFEQTLDALGRLGTVKTKSVNAQDVSTQIVDAQARLRNLRRTETDIRNIMDRSGDIEQVLNVTQQLGAVREQIERLDAQIQGMQYQVAYSTINLTFTRPVILRPPSGFGVLGPAWKNAMASLRDVTIGLLSVGLWLVAFSPYILGLALLAWSVLHRLRALRPGSKALSAHEVIGS
jgi:hypothetical protein